MAKVAFVGLGVMGFPMAGHLKTKGGHDVIGKGEAQSRAPQGGVPSATSNFVSKGFVRNKADKLMLVQAGGAPTTALKKNLENEIEAELGALDWSVPSEESSVASRRSEARMKGYTGEACPECNNFTLVRNGTCLKCDTCGATTGCS